MSEYAVFFNASYMVSSTAGGIDTHRFRTILFCTFDKVHELITFGRPFFTELSGREINQN